LCALNGEREGAPGFFAPVVDDVATAFDPFGDAAVADTLEADKRVTTKGEAPTDRLSNVDTQQLAVNAGRRIGQRRKGHSAQRRPEEWWRRNDTTGQPATRGPKGIGDENRCPTAEAARKKEVEPSAVGSGHTRDSFPSTGDVPIHELPVEYDLPVTRRELRAGEPRNGGRAGERSKPWRA
jgi:hypothetical protein